MTYLIAKYFKKKLNTLVKGSEIYNKEWNL